MERSFWNQEKHKADAFDKRRLQTVDKVPGISRGFSFVVIHIFYIFSVFIKKKRTLYQPES